MPDRVKRVLVTGSSGQLGSEIVRQLRARGDAPCGLDLAAAETTDLIADLRDRRQVQQALEGIDAVIHTAALHGRHMEQGYSREAFIRTNLLGTLSLLEGCAAAGVPKLVYTSTTSLYGHAMAHPERAVWVSEALTPVPRDIYDITKAAAEHLCRNAMEQDGLETVVLRIGRFLPEAPQVQAFHRLYRGIGTSDGARAHLMALDHTFRTFEVYNLAATSPCMPEDLGALFHDAPAVIRLRHPAYAAAFEAQGWTLPARIDRVYDSSKAARELGFTAEEDAMRLMERLAAMPG
ncbi:MAG: NAD(P)-dependent oxidoreductase [Bacteroidia bacterium]|nr:NAD(P)-dependent oxidoreductase [Bacteroidia bacterium]